MRSLIPLIVIAFVANSLTIALCNYTLHQHGGSDVWTFDFFWMPAIWLISMATSGIILSKRERVLFRKPVIIWSLLVLLFVTPVPVMYFMRFIMQVTIGW